MNDEQAVIGHYQRLELVIPLSFRVCFVGVKTKRIENKVENDIFYYLVEKRKQETKNREENFSSKPSFFYPPNLRGK